MWILIATPTINSGLIRFATYLLTGKERNEKLILNQLLSHTPDLVALRSPESPVPETFQLYGIVLFADISGTICSLLLIIHLIRLPCLLHRRVYI